MPERHSGSYALSGSYRVARDAAARPQKGAWGRTTHCWSCFWLVTGAPARLNGNRRGFLSWFEYSADEENSHGQQNQGNRQVSPRDGVSARLATTSTSRIAVRATQLTSQVVPK